MKQPLSVLQGKGIV